MPLHPEYAAMLEQMQAAEGPALTDLPVEGGREMYRVMQPERPDVAVGNVEDRELNGVPTRIYTPAGEGPFPIVMMFHGGGWVIGDLVTADAQSREVCNGVGAIVVSVDYRLAPEHVFPAAADDCYAATAWVAEHGATLNGDTARIAVAGDSAGGNLAAVVAQMARDKGGPALVFQLLVYPVTDGSSFDTESYRDNADGYMLTAESMNWFWNHYAPDHADRQNPYASPLLADDLGNLPPALIMTAEFDPLRDEGEAYAEKLTAAGNVASSTRYPGLIHGFFAQSLVVSAARGPMDDAIAALKGALG